MRRSPGLAPFRNVLHDWAKSAIAKADGQAMSTLKGDLEDINDRGLVWLKGGGNPP